MILRAERREEFRLVRGLDSSRRELPDGWKWSTLGVIHFVNNRTSRFRGDLRGLDGYKYISLRMHHELITNIRRLSCIYSLAQLTLSYRFDIPFYRSERILANINIIDEENEFRVNLD